MEQLKMKTTILTILILITVTGFSQRDYFVNLDWTRQCVKAQNSDLELIYKAKDYLEYKTSTGYIAYEFTGKICTASIICVDSVEAARLIHARVGKNWVETSFNHWDYYTACYSEPVKVVADWYGASVIFRYTRR